MSSVDTKKSHKITNSQIVFSGILSAAVSCTLILALYAGINFAIWLSIAALVYTYSFQFFGFICVISLKLLTPEELSKIEYENIDKWLVYGAYAIHYVSIYTLFSATGWLFFCLAYFLATTFYLKFLLSKI